MPEWLLAYSSLTKDLMYEDQRAKGKTAFKEICFKEN